MSWCGTRRGVDVPWVASDGTRWLYFAQFKEWTGWQPGEDGVWSRTVAEFRADYPEAPRVDDKAREWWTCHPGQAVTGD